MANARCPECGAEVGPTWRWCLSCGYDPDGAREQVAAERDAVESTRASWLPVIATIVVLLIAAGLFVRSTSSDGANTSDAPPTDPVVTAPPSTVPPVWSPFTAPDHTFTVDLPGVPVATDGSLTASGQPNVPQHSYIANTGAALAGVMVYDWPGAGAGTDPSALLQFLPMLAGEQQSSTASSNAHDVGGHPGLDYTMSLTGSGEVRGRLVLVPGHVLNVFVAGGSLDQQLADRVVDSFNPS
jgi:hypothetical protein